MKIHILFETKNDPWGGGNQFLKSLRENMRIRNVYEDDPLKAEGLLINSHHNIIKCARLKIKYPEKIIIHRLDGPVVLGRPKGRSLDGFIFLCNHLLADGTVFQSTFSREQCYANGMKQKQIESIIINAPNPAIFYPVRKRIPNRKVRLIATSWSTNVTKGFDIYHYLDQKLDFSRYDMTFVGNSPINFKNIIHHFPVRSLELANILREHDIFITASRVDPCSNSLLEGLHCGLPAVARHSGGHPGIVQQGGILFDGEHDVLKAIDTVADRIGEFRDKIDLPNINMVTDMYINIYKSVESYIDKHDREDRFSMFALSRIYACWYWLKMQHLV